MKVLRDLTIIRKELQDWERNLTWGRDGTLYIASYPDICIAQPIYEKKVELNSKNLFHVRDYTLEYENKFEYESAGTNSLLNSQPISYGRIVQPCPANNLLAVLTTNLNVIIFKNQKMVLNLDNQAPQLERRAYHSIEWAPDGKHIAVGNENSGIIIFAIEQDEKEFVKGTFISEIQLESLKKDWVTKICWKTDMISACLGDNSIFVIEPLKDFKIRQIAPASRFKIVDLCLLQNYVLVTDLSEFRKIEIESGETVQIPLAVGDEFHIIPISEESNKVVLLSNRTSFKILLDEKLKLAPDDIVSPVLERKFKKWNSVNNEFNNYETAMLIYGMSLSPDGYSVAIMYSMERVSLKYRIASEYQFHIAFVSLYDSWEISSNAIGLAWYQTYQIYACTLPSTKQNMEEMDVSQEEHHVDLSFKKYIKKIIHDKKMNISRFFNFVEDVPSIKSFRMSIFEYGIANSSKISNPLDKAALQSLAAVLNISAPINSDVVTIKSEFICENFDFEKSKESEFIISEEGHTWRRCSVTLLPILTTRVKICPISNQRTIDITRDNSNEYGWFTRTLLETFNDESLYCGATMTTA